MVGIGEAAYTPAGAAVITASFPERCPGPGAGCLRHRHVHRRRNRHQPGRIHCGQVRLAVRLFHGWDTRRHSRSGCAAACQSRWLRLPKNRCAVRELLRVPAFLALLVSGFFCSFAGYSYVVWGPELVQDYKGFSRGGSQHGAWADDRAGRDARHRDRRVTCRTRWRSCASGDGRWWSRSVLCWPLRQFILRCMLAEKLRFLLFFGLGAFFLSWYHGPLTATIHDLVPPRGHATALGFYYLFVNLFSMAIAPVVVGRAGGPLQPDYCFACTDYRPTGGSGVFCVGDPMHSARRVASSGTGPPLG